MFKILIYLAAFFTTCLFADNEQMLKEIEVLQKKNAELFGEVKVFTDKILQKEKDTKYILKLDGDSSVNELQSGLKRAYGIAKLNGLHVEKLKALYALSKKVILRTDFVKKDSKQAISVGNSFQDWFDFTGANYAKIQEEKAKAEEQKVAFYKKTTIQYIKALTARDATVAYKEFSKYVDALRTIQSADAEQLIAQAEMLVAEQKLVADLSSALPLVGESLDIVAIVTAKDLSGQQLSTFQRGFAFVALVTPEVLTQLIKRNPAVAKALGEMGSAVNNMSKEALKKVASQKTLQGYMSRLEGASDEVLKWRRFYDDKIVEAKKLASMSSTKRFTKAKNLEDGMESVFSRKNNLGDELGEKISQTAKKRDEIIITRPTSDDLPARLREGAYTKGMNVKGKSADSGIASGYVPTKQKFSKLNDADEIAKFQKKVDESLETVEVNGVTITPQRVSSKQLIVTRNNMRLEGIEIFKKGSDESIAVFKTADGKIVTENFEEISKDVLEKYDVKNAKPFEVLTDMKGNYLAADIDLLSVGSKKRTTIMQNDELMGNINSNEMGTVADMNRAMKSKAHPDRQLVHHGGEASFMNKGSKLDFPITAYSPDGKVAVMQSEAELKAYFHMQKLRGYDLQPNPYWGWGKYDPKKGYE
jgi:hypothetical protein